MKFRLVKQVHMIQVLRSRPFALLWLGQSISRIGDGAYITALAWTVLQLTGSGTAMSIVMIAYGIPNIIFLLLGGVAADRFPRQLILLYSDVGRAAFVFIAAILGFMHILQVWHLVILSLFFGFIGAFFTPAYQSIIPQVVKNESISSANSLNSFGISVSQLIGPAIGAGLVALLGFASAFAFDALTFVVSAFCLLAIRPTLLSKSECQEIIEKERSVKTVIEFSGLQKLLLDVSEGFRYIKNSQWLWVTTIISAIGNIGYAGALSVALPKLVHDVYHAQVWLLGALGTASAVGAIIAAVILGQLGRIHHRGIIAYSVLILSSSSLIIFGLPLSSNIEPLVACLADASFGFGIEVFTIIWITVLQELVPNDKQGRVFSIDMLSSTCTLPIGFALVGILTDHIGPAWVFIASGILNLLLIGIGLCAPGIRQLD